MLSSLMTSPRLLAYHVFHRVGFSFEDGCVHHKQSRPRLVFVVALWGHDHRILMRIIPG